MMLKTIQNKIRKSFSDAALHYDVLTSLHKEIGRELVKKTVSLKDASSILDVGTGTGYVAAKAKFFFPQALVVGVDIADGMLKKAKETKEGIAWVQADAGTLPFQKGSFDLIVSNLSYQWVPDLKQAFQKNHDALKDDGYFCATLFGYETLKELFASLQASMLDESAFPFRRLPTAEMVQETLSGCGYRDVQVDFERIKVEFADTVDLLRWLKKIGANVLNPDVYIGKDLLGRTEKYYRKNFPYHNGIETTFEVIWILAKK